MSLKMASEMDPGKRRTIVSFLVLGLLVVFGMALSLSCGSAEIRPGEILGMLFAGTGSSSSRTVLFVLRLPRMLMAGVLGGALALSGYLLQTYFQNPIAGPFVMGISSGARLTLTVWFVCFAGRGILAGSWGMIAAAFAGALLATGFLLLLSRRIRHIAVLLVAGIMVGYVSSSITELLVNFARDQDIVDLHGWSQGSFSGMRMADVGVAALTVGLCFFAAMLLAKPIGAYQLGERYARSMGVDVGRMRPALILLASLLAATVTAFAGPVSFVGIAVPFLVRRSFSTSRTLILIPAVFLGGAAACLFSDVIARAAFAPAELSVSTVTSALGAPVVILLLWERRREA